MNITFFQYSIHDAVKARASDIYRHINELSDEEVASSDADLICAQVVADHGLPEMAEFAAGEVERDEPEFERNQRHCTVKVYVPYKGEVSTFSLYDRSRPVSPPPPSFEVDGDFLVRTYCLDIERPAEIDKLIDEDHALINEYLRPIGDAITRCIKSLLNVAKDALLKRTNELKQKNTAAAKIAESKVRVRRRNDGIEKVILPVKRKAISLTPSITTTTPSSRRAALPEFELGIREYDDILDVISSMIHVVERTPSVFASMGEEALRTVLLVALNGIYEGQATGETFNGSGKTDILIRRADKNVFIAECLVWKGEKVLLDKLNSQLFQYAMWRDSKLAIIVFNRRGNFSSVVNKMKEAIAGHSQCLREIPVDSETGYRFEFRRQDDPDRRFLLSAIAFDVPSP